jgi:bacterial/archaeal transporter family protein
MQRRMSMLGKFARSCSGSVGGVSLAMVIGETLKARWLWYSVLCVFCWGGWALAAKFGSRGVPPETMQFLFTAGAMPVCIALLIARRFKLEKSPKGIFYAILNGVLSSIGSLAVFAAYHTNGNTSLITSLTALYPMITVLLAITILRERFGVIQAVGLGFAAVAVVIFSQ